MLGLRVELSEQLPRTSAQPGAEPGAVFTTWRDEMSETDAKKVAEGGPAFAVGTRDWPGMTLRDYFAGQALAGMMANPKESADVDADSLGEWAYQIADGLLRARSAKPGLLPSETER
jgi:hypothetical protein